MSVDKKLQELVSTDVAYIACRQGGGEVGLCFREIGKDWAKKAKRERGQRYAVICRKTGGVVEETKTRSEDRTEAKKGGKDWQ